MGAKGGTMTRLLPVLAGLCLAGFGLASGGDTGPSPSAVALAHGYPPGPYSEAVFEISDDAAVMVLRVDHAGRSMRLWGDGRLEIQAGDDERYSRRLDRSRLLEIFRAAVDHGLAEFGTDLLVLEIGADAAFRKPCETPRVEATLRFTAYDRHGAGANQGPRGICPADYPQLVQSRALADLAAVLDGELEAAKREGSIEIPAADYKAATFTLSSDPAQLILSFRMSHGYSGMKSLSLYGDGRLELRITGRDGRDLVTRESFDRSLTYPDMVSLVRLAVDHGLAEWDSDSLRFHGITARSTHTQGAAGELHLESYDREEYSRIKLARQFKFGDIRMAREFSADVLQVRGLESMIQALDSHFESARKRVEK